MKQSELLRLGNAGQNLDESITQDSWFEDLLGRSLYVMLSKKTTQLMRQVCGVVVGTALTSCFARVLIGDAILRRCE